MIWQWLLLFALFVIAASAQRVTGIGFALIGAPAAMIFLGNEAISLVTLLGAISGVLTLVATWRQRRLREIVPVTLWALPLLFVLTLVVPLVAPAPLRIGAGVLVIVVTVFSAARMSGAMRTVLYSAAGAGSLVAICAATAGLAGPAAAAHGSTRAWDAAFVPNVQVVLLATTPFVIAAHGWSPSFGAEALIGASFAVAVGTVLGSLLRPTIDGRLALRGTQMLSLLGGVSAIISGAMLLA